MHIGKSKNLEIDNVKNTDSYSYLGVIFDCKLNWANAKVLGRAKSVVFNL